MSNVIPIFGAELTAADVLERTLDKVDRVRDVVVLIQWDDGTWAIDASTQTLGNQLSAATTLRLSVERQMQGFDE